MRLLRFTALLVLLALAGLSAIAGTAGAVAVTAGTGSGLAGQNVDIDISATTTLTGLSVQSLQFSMTYNAALVTPVAIVQTGTSSGTAGWATPTFGTVIVSGTQGTLTVSAAGVTPLAGAGSMLKVRFALNPAQLTAATSFLTFTNFKFNEGTPTATTTNGRVDIGTTPVITASPDNGEIVRGQTLQFTVSGSVTNPVAWSTTDNAIATINSAGLLTGVGPGSVKVIATDAASRRDTTNTILVRGMGLGVTNTSAVTGQTLTLPITTTTLTGLGIRSGQVTLSWANSNVIATGVTTPAGTLLNGYGTVGFGASNTSTCTVDFVGSTDLSGAGTLFNITFQAAPGFTGGIGFNFTQALFNENLPAKTTNGSGSFTALPIIIVNPDQVTLLAGQTQQMTLGGSPTNPVTWSVLDPTIASISPSGLLTALKGGQTKVRAQDNLGAVDLNTLVDVYDFQATVGTVTGAAGNTVRVPITSDRALGALGIYSVQYLVSWSTLQPVVKSASSSLIGSTWGLGNIVDAKTATSIRTAAAGAVPLPNGGNDLAALEFTIPPATANQDVPLNLTNLLCNEGSPRPKIVNGVLKVRNTTAVEGGGSLAFAMAPPQPNPAHGRANLHFTLPQAGTRVTLELLGVDGRRVRTLIDGALPAGAHDAAWNGDDAAGGAVPPGLYFARLTADGRTLTQRIALVR